MNSLLVKNSPRKAVMRDTNTKKVSKRCSENFLGCIDGSRSFTCSTTSGPGRSLYIPSGQADLLESKIKGGGLRKKKKGVVFYSPRHDKSYSSRQSHTGIEADLTFSRTTSNPKSENSLLASGAKMEFIAQTRLHKSNIGFDGLCWGEYLDENEEVEIDVNGFRTGFVVSEFDSGFTPLNQTLMYNAVENGLPGDRMYHDKLEESQVEKHLELVRRIGHTKRRMALIAELGRHSSTLANFLYCVSRDILYVTDTDTLVDYRSIDGHARGAQFLRDGVSDLSKRIAELQFSTVSEKTTHLIEKSVRSFLFGIFDDDLDESDVDEAIAKLNVANCVQEVLRKQEKGVGLPNIS